jgi:cytochrome c
MSSSRKALLAALLLACGASAWAQPQRFAGIGRTATPAEVAAWDIDVRPDFTGLPKGSGSVAQGQQVWEAKCASCHGVFGESNEVFNPLVGGTTADDVRTGRVASLARNDYPGRTTLMKLSTVSTLWDYIRRAMPWNQPKSLTVDEVYAVTAYVLNLGGVLPDEFVLSDSTMAQAQARLPNRNGMTREHAMWPGPEFGGKRQPDVKAMACMTNCAPEPKVASFIPHYARDAHGDLAQQQRSVGARASAMAAPSPAVPIAQAVPADLLQKNSCTACHAPDRRLVGPSWREIARKHEGKPEYLAGKIRSGGVGSWGSIPMPPQALSDEEATRVARWLAAGARP